MISLEKMGARDWLWGLENKQAALLVGIVYSILAIPFFLVFVLLNADPLFLWLLGIFLLTIGGLLSIVTYHLGIDPWMGASIEDKQLGWEMKKFGATIAALIGIENVVFFHFGFYDYLDKLPNLWAGLIILLLVSSDFVVSYLIIMKIPKILDNQGFQSEE